MIKFLKAFFKDTWLYLLVWGIIETAMIFNIGELLMYNSTMTVVILVTVFSSLPIVIALFYRKFNYNQN